MFYRLKTIISKAPHAIFFMKDRWLRVISYMLFISIIAVLPLIIKTVTTKDMPNDRYLNIQTAVTYLEDANMKIEDYQLSFQKGAEIQVDFLKFAVGTSTNSMTAFFVLFDTEGLKLIMANQVLNQKSYFQLELNDLDFNNLSQSQVRYVAFKLKEFINEVELVFFVDIVGQYFAVVLDYIFIALILALMSTFFFPLVQTPFSAKFKLSIYLGTMYIFSDFFLTLFGLQNLTFISIIVVYIYHMWVYRSIRIIPKGDNSNEQQQ